MEPSKQPKFNYKSTPTSCDMTLFGIFLVIIFDSFSYLFLSFLRFSLALFLFLFTVKFEDVHCACLYFIEQILQPVMLVYYGLLKGSL